MNNRMILAIIAVVILITTVATQLVVPTEWRRVTGRPLVVTASLPIPHLNMDGTSKVCHRIEVTVEPGLDVCLDFDTQHPDYNQARRVRVGQKVTLDYVTIPVKTEEHFESHLRLSLR